MSTSGYRAPWQAWLLELPSQGPPVTHSQGLSCPPPGSQCGSGAEWGLPRLFPQVYALAGGIAAGGHL